jgi:phenylalanyl-tRNA synthetase alpha chain
MTPIERLDAHERDALAELDACGDGAALEAWRVRHLGSKGSLKGLMSLMKEASAAERPLLGQRLNALKGALEGAFDARKEQVGGRRAIPSGLDFTEPGLDLASGRRHVLTGTIDRIVEVFGRMGFSVAEGPEIEDEWHNFTALNIPAGHPARDPNDNFFLGGEAAGRLLLRTQTSTVQIRAMEATPPPLRVIAVGRVYRPDDHDATHYSMFHQVEGLAVDRGITMADLKGTLLSFARAFFGPEAEVRMRPSFFPFTEPSAEVDMRMPVKGTWQWVEIGGCGLVDPAVFEAVGIDPEVWSGFAFGLGIERITMRRYGLGDIRRLFENDARFLRQF